MSYVSRGTSALLSGVQYLSGFCDYIVRKKNEEVKEFITNIIFLFFLPTISSEFYLGLLKECNIPVVGVPHFTLQLGCYDSKTL